MCCQNVYLSCGTRVNSLFKGWDVKSLQRCTLHRYTSTVCSVHKHSRAWGSVSGLLASGRCVLKHELFIMKIVV